MIPTALLLVITLAAGSILLLYALNLNTSKTVNPTCILSIVKIGDQKWLVYNPCDKPVNASLLINSTACIVIDENGVINATRVTIPPGGAIVVYGGCIGVMSEGQLYRLK